MVQTATLLVLAIVLVALDLSLGVEHICTETRKVEKEKVNWKTYYKRSCEEMNKSDILIIKFLDKDKEYCDFKRSTTTTVTEFEEVSVCCKGYTGARCEKGMCSKPCRNGGVCAGRDICNCEGIGYTGNFCEKPICNSRCLNGGTCAGPDSCLCDEGWGGLTCNKAICTSTCRNGGTCEAPNNCACPLGYSGHVCEKVKFDCGSKCLHGGSCIAQDTCNCPKGYKGDHCEDAICSDECQNDGQCVKPDTCMCSEGFSGAHCEKKDESVNAPPIVDSGSLASAKHEGVCSAWGMNHYMSFDGKQFYFPGECSYNLAFECSGIFHVMVVNRFDCRENACKKAVKIEMGEHHQVMLYPNSTATYNGRFIKMPKTVDKSLILGRIGLYTVIRLSSGVRVFFDNDESVYVAVPDKFKGDMCGLCGNYDDNVKNDFVVNKEKKFNDPIEFGNYFHIQDELKKCSPVPSDPPHPCEPYYELPEIETFQRRCHELLSAGFSACHSTIDPEKYRRSCLRDACTCGMNNYNKCACDSFTQYSRICAYNGIQLNWRSVGLCERKCPTGMIYDECGPSCPATCETANFANECSNNVCIDGCHCPKGTVLDTTTNTCKRQEVCPCTRAGETYHNGDIIQQDCNNCTCSGGRWNCTTKECPVTCSALGEDHYIRFDGKPFQFAGGCEYVLVQTKPGVERQFAIWVQNKGCGFYDNEKCQKTISIKFGNDKTYKLSAHGKVTRGHTVVELPYRDEKQALRFERLSSVYLKMKSDFGMTLMWDGNLRIYVTLNPSFKTKVQGLCGLYDLNHINDFTLPSGAITNKADEFGNSWKTNVKCSANEAATGVAVDACVIATEYATRAEELCAKLKHDAFSNCNSIVNPFIFVKMCKHDVCHGLHKFSANPDEYMCTIFSAYARACARAGSPVISSPSWREANKCSVECSNGRVWDECAGADCERSCQMISSGTQNQCNASSECIEGCRCPKGQVYDEKEELCVEISHCTCYHRNVAYSPGIRRQSVCDMCTCRNGAWKCEPIPECTPETVCEEGMVWSNCTECQRTCDNMDMACERDQCHEGCGCPVGLVLDNDKCIAPESCPCTERGKSYSEGKWIKRDCNYCQCKNTKWKCTERECPGVCSAYGDPHYETFDKERYEFHGDCTYVLAEDFCEDGVGSFRITVENVPCSSGGVTCTKAVKLTLFDTVIHLIRGFQPIISKNPFPNHGMPKAEFRVVKAGLFLIVKTKIGLTLFWDVGTRVYVKLEPKYKHEVCGLCGNFDGNAHNDFKTRQGEIESAANLFGDSWKAFSTCPSSEEEPIHPCTVNPQRVDWAKFSCRILMEHPFSECHAQVDPTAYYDSCIWDSCGCDRGGDCECYCTAVAAYVRECNDQDVHIRWRSTGSCGLQCESGMEYQECGTTCSSTCWNESEDEGCTGTCVEGCHCKNGTVLYDGQCIERQQCPCKVGNIIISPGQILPYNCMSCMCVDNQLRCNGTTCGGKTTTSRPETEETKTLTTGTTTATVVSTTTTEGTTIITTPEITTIKIQTTTPHCQDGMVPTDCASHCPTKCQYLSSQESCPQEIDPCEPGCKCPTNKVIDYNGRCVESMDCKCRDNEDIIHEPGTSWKRGQCERCSCFNNEIQCVPMTCPILSCHESAGMTSATLSGSCCPVCVQTTTFPIESTTVPSTCKKVGENYGLCTCALTCSQMQNNVTCQVPETDQNGKCCSCDEGMVRDDDNGNCISVEECPCVTKDGQTVMPNKTMRFETCVACQCMAGELRCSNYCSVSSCTVGQVLENDEDGCCYCKEVATTTSIPTVTASAFTNFTTEVVGTTTAPISCACQKGYFECDECTKCVRNETRCDGEKQCQDGSDEKRCPCNYKGETKLDGDTWDTSECESCTCNNTQATCIRNCSIECALGFYLQTYNDSRCCECLPVSEPTSAFVSTTGSLTTTSKPLVVTEATETITKTTEVSTEGLCATALGMESGEIENDQIFASSNLPDREPWLARIRSEGTQSDAKMHSWAPDYYKSVVEPFLAVNFLEPTEITAVSTQGGEDGRFVRRFKIEYFDPDNWFNTLTKKSKGPDGVVTDEPVIFTANDDDHTVVKHLLPSPIIVRNFYILPINDGEEMSLRIELHGCAIATTTKETPPTTPPTTPDMCDHEMGLAVGASNPIASPMLTASSTKEGSSTEDGRLNRNENAHPQAWEPEIEMGDQYLQVTFEKLVVITTVLIQGGGDYGWVIEFNIRYRKAVDEEWRYVMRNGIDFAFSGNQEGFKIVQHVLSEPLEVLQIQIVPRKWKTSIRMRIDFKGCLKAMEPSSTSAAIAPTKESTATTATVTTTTSKAVMSEIFTSGTSAKPTEIETTTEIIVTTTTPIAPNITEPKEESTTKSSPVPLTKETTTIITKKTTPVSEESTSSPASQTSSVEVTTTNVIETTTSQVSGSTTEGEHLSTTIAQPTTTPESGSTTESTYETTTTLQPITTTSVQKMCDEKMGLAWQEAKQIANPTFNASSNVPEDDVGRLNSPNAWQPTDDDVNDEDGAWIEIDFSEEVFVFGITTQGDGNERYVEEYKVEYLTFAEAKNWKTARNNENRRIFDGNSDSVSTKTNYFNEPILVSSIKIKPEDWNSDVPSLRLDLRGCYSTTGITTTVISKTITETVTTTKKPVASTPITTTTSPGSTTESMVEVTTTKEIQPTTTKVVVTSVKPTGETTTSQSSTTSSSIEPTQTMTVVLPSGSSTTIQAVATTTNETPSTTPDMCDHEMGLAVGADNPIASPVITASSTKQGSSAKFGRLNNNENADQMPQAWEPEIEMGDQYLQVTFEKLVVITTVLIQGGGNDGWVTEFNIRYRKDVDSEWRYVMRYGSPLNFSGNGEGFQIVQRLLTERLEVLQIQIVPRKWKASIRMRIDFKGCLKAMEPSSTSAATAPTKESTATTATVTTTASKVVTSEIVTSVGASAQPTEIETTTETIVTTTTPIASNITELTEESTTESSPVSSTKETTTIVTKKTTPVIEEKTSSPASQTSSVEVTTTNVIETTTSQVSILTTEGEILSTTIAPSTTTPESGSTTESTYETTTTLQPITTTSAQNMCDEKMGLAWQETKQIANPTFTASSNVPEDDVGRLNSPKAWQPTDDDANDEDGAWIEIDFSEEVFVFGITTQGDGNESFVMEYKVEYLTFAETENWQTARNEDNGHIFDGNSDSVSTKTNYFYEPILVSSIRIKPDHWNGVVPSLRLDLRGCYSTTTSTTTVISKTTTETVTTTKKPVGSTLIPTTTSAGSTTESMVEVTTTKEIQPTTTEVVVTSVKPTGETTTTQSSTTSLYTEPTQTMTVVLPSESSTTIQGESTTPATVTTTPPIEVSSTSSSGMVSSSPVVTTTTEVVEGTTTPVIVKTTTSVSSSTEIISPALISNTASSTMLVETTTEEVTKTTSPLPKTPPTSTITEIVTNESTKTVKTTPIPTISQFNTTKEVSQASTTTVTSVVTETTTTFETIEPPSTTATSVVCKKRVLTQSLGGAAIPGSTYTASSNVELARNAKVDLNYWRNFTKSPILSHWVPGEGDLKPFLQVNFDQPVTVMEISTQGSLGEDKWTRHFFVQYSVDGEEYRYITSGSTGEPKLFDGNIDDYDEIRLQLPSPVADVISIRVFLQNPLGFEAALRMDVIGCYEEQLPTSPTTSIRTVTTVTSGQTVETTENTVSATATPTPHIEVTTTKSISPTTTKVEQTTIVSKPTTSSTSPSSSAAITTTEKVVTESTSSPPPVTTTVATTAIVESSTTSKPVVGSTTTPSSEGTTTTITSLPVSTTGIISSKTQPTVTTTSVYVEPSTTGTGETTKTVNTTKEIEVTNTPPGVCDKPMGMKSYTVPDSAITASTSKDGSDPHQARLNGPKSWSPEDSDENPFLEIKFPNQVKITSILTQGGGNGEMVREFNVKYASNLEDSLVFITEESKLATTQTEEENMPKTFVGNENDNEIKEHVLREPVVVRVIHILPIRGGLDEQLSLRVEFHGCVNEFSTSVAYTVETTTETIQTTSGSVVETTTREVKTSTPLSEGTTTKASIITTTNVIETTSATVTTPELCGMEMGVNVAQTNKIGNPQVSVSSNTADVENARLHREDEDSMVQAWTPIDEGTEEYVQVDFETTVTVTTVLLRGGLTPSGEPAFVSSFTMQYTLDEDDSERIWTDVTDDSDTIIFQANTDAKSIVTVDLNKPIDIKAIRIYPKEWSTRPALQIELIGCYSTIIMTTMETTTETTTTSAVPTSTKSTETTTEAVPTSIEVVSTTTRVYPTTTSLSFSTSSTETSPTVPITTEIVVPSTTKSENFTSNFVFSSTSGQLETNATGITVSPVEISTTTSIQPTSTAPVTFSTTNLASTIFSHTTPPTTGEFSSTPSKNVTIITFPTKTTTEVVSSTATKPVSTARTTTITTTKTATSIAETSTTTPESPLTTKASNECDLACDCTFGCKRNESECYPLRNCPLTCDCGKRKIRVNGRCVSLDQSMCDDGTRPTQTPGSNVTSTSETITFETETIPPTPCPPACNCNWTCEGNENCQPLTNCSIDKCSCSPPYIDRGSGRCGAYPKGCDANGASTTISTQTTSNTQTTSGPITAMTPPVTTSGVETTSTRSTTSVSIETTTPIVCTRPLQAKLCGRNVTCKDKIQTTSCVPGCFCPDGMFRDGLRCVENTDCPCFVDDQRYPSGGTWNPIECRNCTCTKGIATCVNETCLNCTEGTIATKVQGECCPACIPTTTPSTVATTTTPYVTNATTVTSCAKEMFRCNNSHCIPAKWRCDENPDCADRSDEENCPTTTTRTKPTTETTPFLETTPNPCVFDCGNGECLPNEDLVCDGTIHCSNGKDEAECTSVATTSETTTETITNPESTTAQVCSCVCQANCDGQPLGHCESTCQSSKSCVCPVGTQWSTTLNACMKPADFCPCENDGKKMGKGWVTEPDWLSTTMYMPGETWINGINEKMDKSTNERDETSSRDGTLALDQDSTTFWEVNPVGDNFDRELEFNFVHIYNVVGFRMDCRLSDATENVDKVARLMAYVKQQFGAYMLLEVATVGCKAETEFIREVSKTFKVEAQTFRLVIEGTPKSGSSFDGVERRKPEISEIAFMIDESTMWTEGDCRQCNCTETGQEVCSIACNLTAEDCTKQGLVLSQPIDACCGCVPSTEVSTNGPVATTSETTTETTTTLESTTTQVQSTTPKPTCSNDCLCLSDCDGSTIGCSSLLQCTSACECPNSEFNNYDRSNWRCVLTPPAFLCSVTTTKTKQPPTTNPTTTQESTTLATTQSTTIPVITTTTPCALECVHELTCEEMREQDPFNMLWHHALYDNPFLCEMCPCPEGSSKDDFGSGMCLIYPETCEGCVYKNKTYPIGSKIKAGTCEECECSMVDGAAQTRCYQFCNILSYTCASKNMVLVNEEGSCCYCKALPTTTTVATTTTLETTTPYSGPVCDETCTVDVSCKQQRNYIPLDSAPPFESNSNCGDCACQVGSVKDVLYETEMCLRIEAPCKEPCEDKGIVYPFNVTYTRGECQVCICVYESGLSKEYCEPFCSTTKEDCASQGKELSKSSDGCCKCVEPEATTTTPTFAPVTTTEKFVNGTPSVTEATSVATTTMGTTTSPTCSDSCVCQLGCNGEQDDCVSRAGCNMYCNCPKNDQTRVNGRCANEPTADQCIVATTTSRVMTTTGILTTKHTEVSTTRAPCIENEKKRDMSSCLECTCIGGNYSCETYCHRQCNTGYQLVMKVGTCCYCAPKIISTTGSIATTSAAIQTSTAGEAESTTSAIVVTETSTTTGSVVTTKPVSTTTLVTVSTTAVTTNCSWDCNCFISCSNQIMLDEGDLPIRCLEEDPSRCDLCACKAGFMKDPTSRKCVKYETNCKEKCTYNGRTYEEGEDYWKGSCIHCQCLNGQESCDNSDCGLTQDDCNEMEQRFIDIPGTCCYCAPYNVTVATTTTAPATVTSQPNSVSTTPLQGCLYEGKVFTPGSVVIEAIPGNTCYAKKCADNGTVITVQRENCLTPPSSPTSIEWTTTTAESSSVSTTMPVVIETTNLFEGTTTTQPEECFYEGMDYNKPAPDNIWESDCEMCRCVNNTKQCVKVCRLSENSCGAGEIVYNDPSSNECCKCVAQMCKYEGEFKQFGESWEIDDCMTCSCINASIGVTCSNTHDCKVCEKETEIAQHVEGQCCPQCVARPPPISDCAPVKVQRVWEMSNCTSDGEVELTTCQGRCESNTTMLAEPPFIQTNCRCCKPAEVETRTVSFTCEGGSRYTRDIPHIVSCSCADCEYDAFGFAKNQAFVGLTDVNV
ncbi:uncharacterized protein LOC143445613 isoform X3 [Clavelina lepadiformis]|uniref:uncharacterized protein LOC143445613 isoform X3 n=1 Tax=Clavelina lepadiformis TaxID=159417 RepID=UPI004042F358